MEDRTSVIVIGGSFENTAFEIDQDRLAGRTRKTGLRKRAVRVQTPDKRFTKLQFATATWAAHQLRYIEQISL